ncbi:MAG TPA: DUF1697 domain-containing protein [Acidimicrobiales bacterium]
MAVMVALLRGVNVGGKNALPMADLRAIATGCGHTAVRTYIQSGNLVFDSATTSTAEVAEQLQSAIAAATKVHPDVVVRTRDELAAVVAGNPFLKRRAEPGHLHVVFLTGDQPAKVPIADLRPYAPEEATAHGRELYLFLPNGVGRSKLAADLTRSKGRPGTMRNWATVTKLLALADDAP